MTHRITKKPPRVLPRQRWRFERQEGEVTRILPGGAGDLGIAEFDGYIPAAHVSTMLRFDAWAFVAHPPEPILPSIDCGDGPPVEVS
jgi:hypothetical protein